MKFRLLGPLEATSGSTPLNLGSRKPRALLARLLLEPNRPVPVERLVDDLWGDEAPESAAKMVQIYVSQLRKALPPDVLVTRPPGYLVRVPPEALDVTAFMTLRDEGRAAVEAGDAASGAALLNDALAVWRGPALAEFSEPFAQVEGAHLEELRLACLEERMEADLAAGRHADIVGELEVLVTRHPLREAPHRLLMLALYRSGRQAEALAAYERFRRTLDEELAIEPSASLKDLQYRILNQDRALEIRDAPDPVPAPRATSRREAAGDGFFGRTEELARLEAALDAAKASDGRAVLIAGRAGIGKTRLVAALAERARASGATVLSGRCIQLIGTGLPFLPLVDALRPVGRSLASGELGGELRELPRLVRELAGPGADLSAPPVGATAESHLRLFDEVLAALERLSESKPLLLILEDLQWADESTLDLVAFLAHALGERKILLVATHRSEDIHLGAPLQRLASGLVGARMADAIELGPLGDDVLEDLLMATGDSPTPETVASICSRSEGNPFFAKELLAATVRGETSLPSALRDALLATVAGLSADSQAVLRIAAAAGRDIPYGLLASVAPVDELALAEALRAAVEMDVLVADQESSTFRFRHSLFAEAIYGTLLPGEREALHERLARALTEQSGRAASGGAAEAAQHWAAARRPAEALTSSLLAAREAEAVSGLTEALGHVERVLDLWDDVPDAEELAGVALPSVLAWATELAGMSVEREDEVSSRLLLGIVGPDESVDASTVAVRLGVTAETAVQALGALERDGLVEQGVDGLFRVAGLGMTEARRLYPAAVVLESVAVRRTPRFEARELDLLRAANERLRGALDDPARAIAADDDFHRHLTAGCGNEQLLAALRPVKRALLRYERVYMLEPARIERSVAQHDAIIAALESGDHAEAAQLLRENLTRGLPALAEAVEG